MLVEISQNKYRYICSMLKRIINIFEIEYEGILPEFYSSTLFASPSHIKPRLTIIRLWLLFSLFFRQILRYTYGLINFWRINTRILRENAFHLLRWAGMKLNSRIYKHAYVIMASYTLNDHLKLLHVPIGFTTVTYYSKRLDGVVLK